MAASSVLFLTASSARPACASEWGGSVELGAARTLNGEEVFKHSWDVGLAGHMRWRGHYYPGIFIGYRAATDAEPATSLWYASLGVRFFAVFRRFCGRVDVGWAFRHISLDQESVSSTAGGPLFGLGAGVVALRTRRGSLDVLVSSRMTHALDEDFWIQDIGLALAWHFPA